MNINDARIRGDLRVDGALTSVIHDQTGGSLYKKVVSATVSVFNNRIGSVCSGWFVTADGWVATAAHCVLQGDSLASAKEAFSDLCITVVNVNGVEGDKRALSPTNIVVDGAGDFALMKLPGITNQPYLQWGDIDEECNGNRCFVVGNPLGFDQMSVADGVIRDKVYISDACIGGNYNATENVLLSVPTFGGNSGSPIINDKCQVIGQLQFGPSNIETLGGGTSARFLKPVAEAMIQSGSDYTQKGYLGFYPWWPMTAANAKGVALDPSAVQLSGIIVTVNSGSPGLTPVSGPALPLSTLSFPFGFCDLSLNSDLVVITEIDGVHVGNDKNHLSAVTWFKSPGQTVTLKWYAPPSTTLRTTVVTLAAYPASEDGFAGATSLTSATSAHPLVPLPPMTIPSGALSAQGAVVVELVSTAYGVRPSFSGQEQLGRLTAPAYADGLSAPSGPTRPNPRAISNAIFASPVEPGIPNPHALTDFFWGWGQWVDHDMDLSPENSGESLNIPIPAGDPHFDPTNTGTVELPFHRSGFDPATGTTNARQQLNIITPFIDATNIYGSTDARKNWLRTWIGGKLKTSQGGMPPLNDGTMDNAQPTGSAPFVMGDVRANEQPLLLSLHTLFVREHNRWCEMIAAQSPNLPDEQIYQKARVMVEAIVQHITWNEFLRHLLGRSALPAYTGYKPATDTSVANEFSSAAFRLGHSLVSEVLWRLQPNGDQLPLGHLTLRDGFFAPHRVTNEGGLEPIFRGANAHVCQRLDAKIVDSLRNFLFGPPGAGGLDLAALNIQRGRDHGIADYNSVRSGLGLAPKATFADITSDTALQAALSSAYGGDISLIDLWVGGLAEDHLPGSQLGETFHTIVRDQFVRLRDGDPFWFENRMSPALQAYVKSLTLADVIRNNTFIKGNEIRDNVMQIA